MGTACFFTGISHLATTSILVSTPLGLSTAYNLCTPQYSRWSNNDEKLLGNHRCQVSWKYYYYFEFSFLCIHCFCNIPQTTESIFYFVAYIPQEYLPPLYSQTIPPWPLPRPRLSSRLVRRVVPERRLVPERTSLLLLLLSLLLQEDVPPGRRPLLFLSLLLQDVRLMSLLLLLPTCLPIVQRLEP